MDTMVDVDYYVSVDGLQWSPGQIPVKWVTIPLVFWSLLYCIITKLLENRCYVKIKDKTQKVLRFSPEYCCRLVTFIHGLVVTTISAGLHIKHGPVWDNLGLDNKPIHNLVLVISFGYFIFDFLWCCYMRSEGMAMLAHHVVSLFGLFYSSYYQQYGAEVTAVCFGAEITNPILQTRWFLREHNLYNHTMGIVNDYIFVFSFFFWRFVVGSYFLYRATITNEVGLVIYLGGIGLYIISLIFLYHILKFFVRKYILKLTKKNE